MRATLDERYRDLLKLAQLTPAMFPGVRQAMSEMAAETASEWRAWALGQKALPDGQRIYARTGAYARSIKVTTRASESSIEVDVGTTSPVHRLLDEGTRERDLKAMLSSSSKVRRAKDGHAYLVIPFRHNVQGKGQGAFGPRGEHRVTPDIVRFFKARERSGGATTSIVGQQRVPGTRGLHVTRRQYKWGIRFPGQAIGVDPVTRQPVYAGQRTRESSFGRSTWKTGVFTGMVHSGGFRGQHGSYLTFRTMSERSPAASWISPGTKPKRIIEQLERWARSTLNFRQRVTAAAKADIEGILRG